VEALSSAALRNLRTIDLTGSGAVVLSALGFGTLATLTKLAYAAGVAVPTLIAWRFGLAALLVLCSLPLEYRRRGDLWGRQPWTRSRSALAALAVASFVGNTSLYLAALQDVPVSLVAVLFYSYPVFVILIRLLGWGERPTLLQCFALTCSLAGVMLVLGWQWSRVDPRGAAFVLLSAMLYAAYIVFAHRAFRDASPAAVSATVFSATAIASIVLVVTTGSRLSVAGAAVLPLLALVLFATVAPVQLFLYGTVRLGPTPAAVLGTLEPIFSVLVAVVVLGEHLGTERILGGVLVVLAAMLAQVGRGKS